ncbi:DUF4166 domain-containing protein [Herbiconiux sp. CPCC 203407]|uniref:DUF4166 domain-containing protein n=1 Tax=Herbiconiux oxytropis TaxID=2970915 RepID=A0AA41XDC7_9MICO|nr:DUF4166 domain-containing protein [Herbiconiux oxytropis]MCS5720384.1 DUF4166 domain-containing protein [Herbiconiux oxytropis]MCS5725957.1 DUF4166 domain-containing protein [Herbiconiux oxytropis]
MDDDRTLGEQAGWRLAEAVSKRDVVPVLVTAPRHPPEAWLGELHLTSTALELRIGRLHVALPASLCPRVTVVERFDDAANAGEGALYEYTGTFHYEIRPARPGGRRASTVLRPPFGAHRSGYGEDDDPRARMFHRNGGRAI